MTFSIGDRVRHHKYADDCGEVVQLYYRGGEQSIMVQISDGNRIGGPSSRFVADTEAVNR